MSRAPAGYLTEIPYIAQFYREHAPVWLDAVLTALGRRAPKGETGQWCELGCGPGFGLVLLAATNPAMTFHGIDINPDHIAQGRALAAAAGIENVAFHCRDLRQTEALPDFDYIIVRGIYSWVGPEIGLAIRAFLGEKLSPEGVALVHYLALPGAADFMAVHGLFRAVHGQDGISAREAVRVGQDILARLHDGKAGYFAAHPVAALKARQIADDDPDYTAHDFLNAHYTPFAAAQTIADMAAQGLDFVGSATPMDNLDDFSVPGNLRDLFAAQKTPAMRETIRDLAGNQFSRTDLYMRPAPALDTEAHFAALRKLRFAALPGAPLAGGLTFSTRIGPVEAPAAVFAPILDFLGPGTTRSYAEIEALPAFASNRGIVNQALHALMEVGRVHPVPENAPDPEPARRLNAVLLDRHRSGVATPALAAPALGSALGFTPAQRDAFARGAAGPWARFLP